MRARWGPSDRACVNRTDKIDAIGVARLALKTEGQASGRWRLTLSSKSRPPAGERFILSSKNELHARGLLTLSSKSEPPARGR